MFDTSLTELFSLGGAGAATRCVPASENSGLATLTIFYIAVDLML
jgi:hypothetical protein